MSAERPPTRRSARLVAMDLLARREHSQRELELKLLARGFAAAEVAEALRTLAAEGLQCDRRFVENFVLARLQRGQGPLRIQAELRERGVSAELIAAGIAGSDIDWVAQASAARARRFGAARPADYPEKARQARFLGQRGFSSEQVLRALDADDES